MKKEDGFALTEAFLPVLSAFDGDLLMLCNPNNPTGQTIDPGLMERILEVCDARGIRLFVDECFLDLTGVNTSVWLGRMRMLSMVMRQVTTSDSPAGLAMGRAASWCMLLPCAQAASGASARSDVAMMCLIDISCSL